MPIMFCYFDPFAYTHTILAINVESSITLANGTKEEVCDLMASYYATGDYQQIVLKGNLAESAADMIRSYSKVNYNLSNIDIEVLP